eukprot:CAMPEP_0113906346 /NCGR_PEP_ID=MMETSP0780_2-20120614/24681_1 /TAXON_ID=652834 /ORGANISM="Palpitomonas bilix" /LENGTH=45 /DNA_ID=CAMNT_0000900905 /DNA_START=68 /DNA_END=202 /DNA_ORIENTATION=- /assembly_acc=CAM_ASM_000599
MGGGNGQKSKTKKERVAKEKAALAGKGSQLKRNENAKSIVCAMCK